MTVHSWGLWSSRARRTADLPGKDGSGTSSRRSSRTTRGGLRRRLTGTYTQREYCVQYRETDFNFVSRLMEEEGIYYYFEHSDGKHTLKLVDSDSDTKAGGQVEHRLSTARTGRTATKNSSSFRNNCGSSPATWHALVRPYKPKADLGVKAKKSSSTRRGLRDLRLRGD